MVPGPLALRACPLVATTGTALVAVLVLSSCAGLTTSPSKVPSIVPQEETTLRLVVNPDRWWMVDGNATALTATWSGAAPECSVTPEWFHWALSNGSVGVTLSPIANDSTNLSAGASPGGVATPTVRSLAFLECGEVASQVFGFAEANVTIVPSIEVGNFAPLANPVEPGTPTSLSAAIGGGDPPYSYRLSWGDGTFTSGSLSGAGSFVANHTYSTGSFEPQLLVWDSAGLSAHSGVAAPLVVDSGLSAGIIANRSITDVGVPVQLNATAVGAPTGASYDWACPEPGGVPHPASTSSVRFSCTFVRPGAANATFFVFPGGGLAPASATLSVHVVPGPSLSAVGPNDTVELGLPTWVAFNVTNGVPPFVLEWAATGFTPGGSLAVPEDGTVEVPLLPTRTGDFGLFVHATDSEGIASQISTVRLVVEPRMDVSTGNDRAENGSSVDIDISTTVTGGVPPYRWFVAPGQTPSNESPENGTLGTVGSFEWTGTFDSVGETTISEAVVDGSGTSWWAASEFDILAPLSVHASATAGPSSPPGSFVVQLRVSGGLPPYSLHVGASDGQLWNRTFDSDGNASWLFSGAAAGSLDLELSVVDAAGDAVDANLSVHIESAPAGAAAPTASLDDYVVGGVLALGAGVVVWYAILRRAQGRPTPSPPPDPVGVLRGIIEPADGADRTTVELLAEEAGVPLDLARSTLDRLISDGTVLQDRDSDGGEAVSWSRGGTA